MTFTCSSSDVSVYVCVRESVPGKYLVVSVIFNAVLQGDVHSIPTTFAEPCVRQVTCA